MDDTFIFSKLTKAVRDNNQKILSDKQWADILNETPSQIRVLRKTKYVDAKYFLGVMSELIEWLKNNDDFLIVNKSLL